MTSLELYSNFLRKINKNDSNRNINIPKGQFVLLYNEQREIWLSDRITRDEHSDRIDDISELLLLDTPLTKKEDTKNFSSFILPEDFSQYSSSYSLATKQGCSQSVLYNWNSKNKNKNNLLIDANNNPSFEFEETFISFSNNLLNAYKTDFTIDEVFLDYYKLPEAIDIAGYKNVDGSASKTINTTLSNKLANEILNYCAVETERIYENTQGFQIADNRIKK